MSFSMLSDIKQFLNFLTVFLISGKKSTFVKNTDFKILGFSLDGTVSNSYDFDGSSFERFFKHSCHNE